MKRLSVIALIVSVLLVSCKEKPGPEIVYDVFEGEPVVAGPDGWDGVKRGDITYQILVYSFADSDGDGIGDINGIREKLDYIDGLGASAIWLSPIHPSSSYHGYDVTDYSSVNPEFGTEEDFASLVEAAHARGIKVYMDYVLNHSASAHPWFQDATVSPDSPYRDFYSFSQDPQADIAAGRIPQIASEGAAGYDPGQWFDAGKGYRFHSHFNTSRFADFNYGPAESAETSDAFQALVSAADKWIAMGVDGFRLDAVKHIYHNGESNENPVFLKKFYDRMNASYRSSGGDGDIYMIGEVLSEADAVAPYYAGLPALFEFSFWYRLQWAIQNATGRYFVKDILGYQPLYGRYRQDFVEATKLSNHDEDRTGSVLGGDTDRMKLAAAVLLTAGGRPYIYQGEELGYTGTKENGDEYVRTPVLWDRAGLDLASAALSGKVDMSVLVPEISVEAQSADERSVLNMYRTFARVRNTYPALASGKMESHPVYNDSNAAFNQTAVWYMTLGGDKMLVVHNFSENPVIMSFEDSLDKAVLLNGYAEVKQGGSGWKLRIGELSSAVFEL